MTTGRGQGVQETVESQSMRVLELPAVLAMVAAQAGSAPGRSKVLDLRPLRDREVLVHRQREVAEAMHLDEGASSPPLHGFRDVTAEVGGAARGVVLDPTQLLDVAQTLAVVHRVRRFLLERRDAVPLLADRGALLVPLPDIVQEVERCVESDGVVRDDASPRLRELRIRARTVENRIHGRLQGFLRNPAYAKMLQEPYITTRQDRPVLPVKAEHRSQFPGLVLDASASGATVFMEPLAVVELSNDLREARAAEGHEVQQILARLSERVGRSAADIVADMDVLGELDVLAALARFAGEHRAVLPPLDPQPSIRLVHARHPLLGERAVPIDVELGRDFRVLVITGPNTGGKTVTLKTIGLFALMTMAAIPIPASPDTRFGFIPGVYADIGDEQSISQNLSTFSSHITQIARILPAVTPGALVLLDEAGAGTDPREGTSLAVSIIEFLHERGALMVATTHYNELKAFAAHFEGAENAAMEFDPLTLQPTYRIHTGLPGRSLAHAICERLGLPLPLLERARELLGGAHFSMEDLLGDIEEEREETRRKHDQARQARSEAEEMRGQAREGLAKVTHEREKVVMEAAREAERLLRMLKHESHGLVAEARTLVERLEERVSLPAPGQTERAEGAQDPGTATAESVDELRAREQETREHLDDLEQRLQGIAEQAEEVRETRARRTHPQVPAPVREFEAGAIRKGDTVLVGRFNQEGVVVDAPRGREVQVRIGRMHTTVPLDDLQRLRARPAPQKESASPSERAALLQSVARQASVSTRLDLRGMRAEDAAYEVGRYLDEVGNANVPSVTILHGKGTGVLMNVVQEQLRTHPCVGSFRLGEAAEGGWGVTVVTFK